MLTAKHTAIFRRIALFSLIGFILVAVFSCGTFQTFGHHGGADMIECDIVASVTEGVSIRDFALYAALFAMIASLLLVLTDQIHNKTPTPAPQSTIVSQLRGQPPLFSDSIREAFRKGLIHPQVYNSAFN